MSRRNRRRLWIAGGIAAALTGGGFAWQGFAAAPEQICDTVVVERGDVVRTVTAVGSA